MVSKAKNNTLLNLAEDATLERKLDRWHGDSSIYGLERLKEILSKVHSPLSLQAIESLLNLFQIGSVESNTEFRFDEKYYCRNILFEDDRSLLVAITWLPGQASPIHNHCGSACGVKIIHGRATEKRYFRVGEHEAAQDGDDASFEEGEVFGGEGSDDLHVVANHGDQTLKTLHLYSPPLKRESMQIFKEVFVQRSDTGASL